MARPLTAAGQRLQLNLSCFFSPLQEDTYLLYCNNEKILLLFVSVSIILVVFVFTVTLVKILLHTK